MGDALGDPLGGVGLVLQRFVPLALHGDLRPGPGFPKGSLPGTLPTALWVIPAN